MKIVLLGFLAALCVSCASTDGSRRATKESFDPSTTAASGVTSTAAERPTAAIPVQSTPAPTTAAASVAATPSNASFPAGPCAGCNEPLLVASPDLGVFTDQAALVAALLATGSLDNEAADAVADGRAPNQSICAAIVDSNEAGSGALLHQATATFNGQGGVVLVFQLPSGDREVRMYSTGDADPTTGGCLLLFKAEL